MYGKIHNEITYNGIAGVTVGEKTINAANTIVKIITDDDIKVELNTSTDEPKLAFSFAGADTYATNDFVQKEYLASAEAQKTYSTKAEVGEIKENIDKEFEKYVLLSDLEGKDYVTLSGETFTKL